MLWQLWQLWQLLALALPAAALAWLLRWSAVPGGRPAAAIVAGLVVGLFMGPGILARTHPALHERLFLSTTDQTRAIRQLASTHAQELAVLRQSGVSPAALTEHTQRQADQLAPLEDQRSRAAAQARARADWAAHACLALYAFLIGPALIPIRARALARTMRGLITTKGRPIAVGIFAVIAAGAAPALMIPFLAPAAAPFPRPVAAALAYAACIAAPGIVSSLRPGPYIACAMGLFLCFAAALILAWNPPMTLVGAALILGLLLALSLGERSRRLRALATTAALTVALPATAAYAAVYIDLRALSTGDQVILFWGSIVLAVLWCSDGRWGAAAVGWKLLGEPRAARTGWTSAAHAVSAGAGPVQLGLTLALTAAGVIPEALAPGLLLGAALIEVTRGLRQWMAPRLDLSSQPPSG
ncbi:MAG: hypothetical protein SFZ24_01390 [Planctomycetota bacterium]|nr:hypothetical protein [Planctomycetota bacterium]